MSIRVFLFVLGAFLFLGSEGFSGLGDLLELYEQKVWGVSPVEYEIIGKREHLDNLPDHALPMPPLGYIWKRTEKGEVSLHSHVDLPPELETSIKFSIFSDQERMGFLNIQNGVTVQGYTDCIPSSFSDEGLRQFYPITIEGFRRGSFNYWRSHVLDFSTTIGGPKELYLSTKLKENYTPEPYGYWAQTLSANLVKTIKEASGGYGRLLVYSAHSEKTQDGTIIPDGVLFSEYADAPHRQFQRLYNIDYNSEKFQQINRFSGAGIYKKSLAEIPFSLQDLRPIVLKRGVTARSAFASISDFCVFTTPRKEDPLYLSQMMGIRLRAESEVQDFEGKLLYLLHNLNFQGLSEPILQYWGRFLGNHAILLDDFCESKQGRIEQKQITELKEKMQAQGFEDDTLIDILDQIVKNQADASQRKSDFPDYSLNLSQRSLDISIKEEDEVIPAPQELVNIEFASDRAIKGGIKRILEDLEPYIRSKEGVFLEWHLQNMITKDRSEINMFLVRKFKENPHLKISLKWSQKKVEP